MTSEFGTGPEGRHGGKGRQPRPGRFTPSVHLHLRRRGSPAPPLVELQGLRLRRMSPVPWFANARPTEWNASPKLLI